MPGGQRRPGAPGAVFRGCREGRAGAEPAGGGRAQGGIQEDLVSVRAGGRGTFLRGDPCCGGREGRSDRRLRRRNLRLHRHQGQGGRLRQG